MPVGTRAPSSKISSALSSCSGVKTSARTTRAAVRTMRSLAAQVRPSGPAARRAAAERKRSTRPQARHLAVCSGVPVVLPMAPIVGHTVATGNRNSTEGEKMAVTHTRPDTGGTAMPDGTPLRKIRMDDDLWKRLEETAKRADPDSNRTVILRKFARWYVGDIDEMPQRPEPKRF